MRRSIVIAGLCIAGAVAAAAAYGSLTDSGSRETAYRTQKVERGAIVKSVTAAGKLNAVVTVKVGSQISGRVSELLADFNSEVGKDQVIARIDPTTFEARVSEAQADLEVARAQVVSKEAAVAQAQANLANARATLVSSEADLAKAQITAADLERDFKRLSELRTSGAVAVSAIDKARAQWQAAEAQVNVARAQIAAQRSQVGSREAAVVMAEADVGHARAQVEQKAAVHRTAMVNLDNTFIRSPVNGIVIGRDVDVGTVVAASLQAPTLFSIAQDLHHMQVEAAIDEADIGQIQPGQEAVFTVDSFLGQEFRGHVTQVRKQPLDVMNVITYTVVVTTDNPELRLLPGMTANIEIRVSNRAGVLRVPSAALRFRPPDAGSEPAQAAPQAAEGKGKGAGFDPEAQRAQFDEFARTLELDEEQKRKVRAINAETAQQSRALRSPASASEAKGGAASDSQARTQIAKLRDQADARIMALLRPEQQEKFRLLSAERRMRSATPARVWVLDGGKPKAVPIFVGVSDNSHAELVRGSLNEGAEVIVGINREAAAKGSGRLPKLGF